MTVLRLSLDLLAFVHVCSIAVFSFLLLYYSKELVAT